MIPYPLNSSHWRFSASFARSLFEDFDEGCEERSGPRFAAPLPIARRGAKRSKAIA
jgi:hypothetical protein